MGGLSHLGIQSIPVMLLVPLSFWPTDWRIEFPAFCGLSAVGRENMGAKAAKRSVFL
jgi:hypothetical protein